jgi:hypothetical protein
LVYVYSLRPFVSSFLKAFGYRIADVSDSYRTSYFVRVWFAKLFPTHLDLFTPKKYHARLNFGQYIYVMASTAMAPPHKSKLNPKSKPRRKPLPSAPNGPTRTYTINKPWTASNSGYSIGKNRKRIHSIRRKLRFQSAEKSLPGHVRVALERELKALRREEAVGKAELLRQDNMRRFKRGNFFGKKIL